MSDLASIKIVLAVLHADLRDLLLIQLEEELINYLMFGTTHLVIFQEEGDLMIGLILHLEMLIEVSLIYLLMILLEGEEEDLTILLEI